MTPQNDLDETLLPPRFDAAEADAARPVEPLAEVRTGGRLHSFLQTQRRALRRSWPLALALCLLTAVVVGGTTAFIHRQHAAQQEAAQPNVAPAAALSPNANQPATGFVPARPLRAERSEPALQRSRQPERTAVEYVITDEAFARADRDESKRKKERKHKGHGGDEDEGLTIKPRDKKAAKRGGARLVDVITGRDH